MPAAALIDAANERCDGAERHEIAGGVIERLAGQGLKASFSSGFSLGKGIQTGGGLHQAVEAAAAGPRPGLAIGRQ